MIHHSITLAQLKKAAEEALERGAHPSTPVAVGFNYGSGVIPSERIVEDARFVSRGGSAFCLVMAPVKYDEPAPVSEEVE